MGLTLAIAVAIAAACTPVVTQPCGSLDGAQSMSVVDSSIAVGGKTVGARASVARDEMPSRFPSTGRGIGVSIRLSAVQDPTLPEIAPSCVRVERQGESWQTRLSEAPSGRGTDQQGRQTLQATAGDGPRWEPGTKVHLVVWLRINGQLTSLDFGDIVVERVS